jgi:hypothetical protein
MTTRRITVPHAQPAPDSAEEARDHTSRPSLLKHFFSCCRRAAIVGLLPLLLAGVAGPLHAQQDFSSPEAAATAFADALATNDPDALGKVLGADWRRYIPTDGVDMDDVYAFLAGWSKSHKILTNSPSTAHLAIGDSDWTLPIPIVNRGAAWRFDTRAGAEEIRTRRIGRNELAAMQAALAYYDAQKDYALVDRNGDGVLEYAQRIVSTPGKNDGLYWAALAGEPDSPLGPLFGDDRPGDDYHGYYFRILKAQGPNAPGGAYDYRINDRMVSGFGLVAWPVKYGDSGVMTFMVSHDGKLFERDLGPGTDGVVRAMTRFDPGPGWQAVSP